MAQEEENTRGHRVRGTERESLKNRGRARESEVRGGTGPGTILKDLIKPAKCHAATHVPSREARKYVQDEAAGVSTVSASI